MGVTSGLLGRAEERRVLASVISGARNRVGGALLLKGDPGIGKTALLTASTSRLEGVRVLRVDGFEAESTIPFAALQRLMTPLRVHLDALAERQRQALRTAGGVAEGPPPDRFLVGLGVLGLLAAAGLERPVVCVVDDAQWLDSESLDTLAFVARRLQAEPAALLFALRDEPGLDVRMAGVATLTLSGLDTDSALELLMSSLPEPIDPLAAAQIIRATGGNPLALTDLAQELSTRQLTETSLADDPVPIGRHLEAHYLRRVRLVDEDLQLWLLLAAADSTGNRELIEAAAERLGLSRSTGEAAEVQGLVEIAGHVTFRHLLVRSAAYNAAAGAERRRVHRVLAEAAQELGLTELEAWHAARATLGLDADVANRLEHAADLAGRRGGLSSRVSLLRRAAELTPPGSVRDGRLISAAEAALAAGAAQTAQGSLDEVDADGLVPLQRGRLISVRAALSFFTPDPSALRRATADMLTAADCFHGCDVDLEQTALIKAFEYCLPPERLLLDVTLEQLGERLLQGAALRDGVAAVILHALAAHVLLPYAQAVPKMRQAVDTIAGLSPEDLLRYGTISVALTTALWDEVARRSCLVRVVEIARDFGSIQLLDTALWVMSLAELTGGVPLRAHEYMEQVRELRRAIGYDAEHVVNVALLAWTGAPRPQVLAIAEGARATGFGGVHTSALAALATADLAGGRYQDAYADLKPLIDDPFLQVTPLQFPDFVEAAVRSGHREEALGYVERLEQLAAANGSAWSSGVAQRSRALVLEAGPAEEQYAAAIATLATADVEVELARAHLLYGEWLRRLKRRRDARVQLRAALRGFERTGAVLFEDRARRELQATGEPDTAGRTPLAIELTSQEATVARLAAAGSTNSEIGSALFISPNTVDYHLRKVFQKFGITSRRQLAERLRPPS